MPTPDRHRLRAESEAVRSGIRTAIGTGRSLLLFGCILSVTIGMAAPSAQARRSAGESPASLVPAAESPSSFRGEIEAYLEPNDEQGVCSVTIGLRNLSAAWQGEARLRLAWFDANGSLIEELPLRMDPLLPGRFDAKNQVLTGRCATVSRLVVQSAEWLPYPSMEPKTDAAAVVIESVAGSEWQMRWSEDHRLFVGERLADRRESGQ